jgi:RNA polymerase sigma-70 factor, ECF subfamily
MRRRDRVRVVRKLSAVLLPHIRCAPLERFESVRIVRPTIPNRRDDFRPASVLVMNRRAIAMAACHPPLSSTEQPMHYGSQVPSSESMVQTGSSLEDRELVAALRSGDETVFSLLVREHGPGMLRVARNYVSSQAVAEEVVQEAWLGVLRGLDRFEGRSSFKTWLYRILMNTAMSRGEREARTVPFATLAAEVSDDEPAVDPDRFMTEGRWAGHWAVPPEGWASPEPRLLEAEAREVIDRTIAQLPEAQAIVITMCDIEGFGPDEICNVLEISLTNQRVLLHRARSRVRRALEDYMGDTKT